MIAMTAITTTCGVNICLLNGEEGSLGSKTNSYSRLSQSAPPACQAFERRGKGDTGRTRATATQATVGLQPKS